MAGDVVRAMRRSMSCPILASAAVVALHGSAHAMGTDRTAELRAWNRDGSAALIEEQTARDGDQSRSYAIVAVGAKAVEVTISWTMRQDGKDIEQIAVSDCVQAANRLSTASSANRIAGIAIDATQCKRDRRKVVTVRADGDLAWIALPQGRLPTVREQAAWDVVKQVAPAYKPFLPDAGCTTSNETIDVANKTGRLILVFSAWTCSNPIRTTVRGFVPTKTGYVDAQLWGAS